MTVTKTVEANRRKITLHRGQCRVFQTDARFSALIAGTGGGKTYVGPWGLAKEIEKNPTGTFGVGAPTFKILNRTTVPTLIAAYRGTELEGEYKGTAGEYHLPTGGIIYLCSTDDADHLEGGQYSAWWLDEAGQMSAQTWTVIQARLGYLQGRCLFTTTPYNLGWFYKEIYLRAKAGDPDYFVVQFRSTLNPGYSKAEFERARRTMDSRLFEMRYLGEFRKMAGLVWPEFDQWVVEPGEVPEPDARCQHIGGIDWGFNNPFVALDAFLDHDDVLWVHRERYLSRTLLADHAAALNKDTAYYADPSGKQETEEMRNFDLLVNPAINDVSMGLERVAERGLTGRLKISSACKHLLSNTEMYHYKEGEDKPVKDEDHGPDALRYMIMGLDGKPEPKVISLNFGTDPDETSDGEDMMMTEDPRYWRED
ncbi:hypothetical protein LCGC14_0817590 [marine sediment metagenome]|uniref:Uncharacterized protein n=1 Tax=marine sediment metagenome TaxID=412755 RepID=A0A0F9SS97_9ZZZZ